MQLSDTSNSFFHSQVAPETKSAYPRTITSRQATDLDLPEAAEEEIAVIQRTANWQSIIIWTILTGFCFFVAYPWWPLKITSLESDSISIAYGVAQCLHEHAFQSPYRYECQSGSYHSILWLSQNPWMGMQPLMAFRLLTMSGFVVFAFSAVYFLHALLGYPKWFCLISLLLFQETFVSSYYPNTNMMALPWAMTALAILVRGNTWQRSFIAGVLYGVGVWMRVDLVLISLVFPLAMKPHSRRDWGHVGLLVLTSVVVSNGLIYCSHVELSRIISTYRLHSDTHVDIDRTFWMYVTIFTALTLIATLCGLGCLWKNRSWRLCTMVAAGFLPNVAAFGLTVTTPKYLLYSLAFVAIASSVGLWWFLNSAGRIGKVLVYSLFILQYVANPFGLHVDNGIVSTHDCSRHLGSIFVSNILAWHQENVLNETKSERLKSHMMDYINRENNGVVVIKNFTHQYLVPYYLLTNDFELTSSSLGTNVVVQNFGRKNRRVTLLNVRSNRATNFTCDELASLGVTLPRKVQMLGYVKPDLLPTMGEPKVRGTGKYGTYTIAAQGN